MWNKRAARLMIVSIETDADFIVKRVSWESTFAHGPLSKRFILRFQWNANKRSRK